MWTEAEGLGEESCRAGPGARVGLVRPANMEAIKRELQELYGKAHQSTVQEGQKKFRQMEEIITLSLHPDQSGEDLF